MNITTVKPADRTGRSLPWLPWLAVLAVLLCVGAVRVHLLDVPLERDEGEYAYAGQLILQGIPPCELAYNMKLPGTYFAYAAGLAVFGQTTAGVHLTLLAVNSLTCLFLFLFGRQLAGPVAGVAACAAYAVLSLSPAVLGLAGHATQFVVLFAVPGAWALWQALATGQRWLFVLAGGLFGVAFMMKQPGLCFGLFGGLVIVGQGIRRGALSQRPFWWRLFVYGLALALPFVLFCLWALVRGNFTRFWFWTFHYAAHYGAGVTLGDGVSNLVAYAMHTFWVYAGFELLAVVGLLAMLRRREKRAELFFVLGLLGFALLGTSIGFYYREHYFILMLPAFALLLGVTVSFLPALLPPRLHWAAVGLVGLVSLASLWPYRNIYCHLGPVEICRLLYPENPFPDSLPVARYIQEHSRPDARVAVVGSEPQIYFYARRHSATGYIYTYALMEPQPYATTMQQEMIREIEAVRPEFLVIIESPCSWLAGPASDHAIFQWAPQFASKYYDPIPAQGWDGKSVILLQRKLDARP